MKRILIAALAVSSLAAAGPALRAQDQTTGGPPKILFIGREMVKVGKDSGHEKNEAAFAQAMAAAKAPEHYVAAVSISGSDEAWFFNGFDSWEDAQKSHAFNESHAALKAQLDRLQQQDADYISDATTLVATYNEKWSYHPNVSLADMRFFEIETIQLRTGHAKDWEQLVSLYQATAEKAHLTESDVFYEVRYGAVDGTVLIFTPRKSAEDLDAAMGTSKAFNDALGESGQKRWAELVEAAIATARADLLVFDPEMSYAPEDFVKANPDFWKPKQMGAPKAAAEKEKKPAEAPAKKQ